MVQSELDEPPAPNFPDQQNIQDIPIKFEVVRRICDTKRKIFTVKTIGGFQRGLGNVGLRLDLDGAHQIPTLHEEVKVIAVVTAGPIA
jgi:hypothetical protein